MLSDATVTKGHVQGYAIAVASRTRGPSVRLVISGPEGGKWVRPTPAVFAELVASAVDEILFLSYALRHGDSAVDLLLEACARGVTVRGVLDRRVLHENMVAGDPGFAELQARGVELFTWATTVSGQASIHSKALVVDSRRVFVTSANLTGRAFNDNLETGLLAEDPSAASELVKHVDALISNGFLARF